MDTYTARAEQDRSRPVERLDQSLEFASPASLNQISSQFPAPLHIATPALAPARRLNQDRGVPLTVAAHPTHLIQSLSIDCIRFFPSKYTFSSAVSSPDPRDIQMPRTSASGGPWGNTVRGQYRKGPPLIVSGSGATVSRQHTREINSQGRRSRWACRMSPDLPRR